MGLMLVEIGLGLYEMALLHLFAHSFYKSWSFLNSGNTVNHYLAAKLAGDIKPAIHHWVVALAIALLMIAIAQWQFVVMSSLAATVLMWFALSALILPSVTHWDNTRILHMGITLAFAGMLLTLYTVAKHHLKAIIGPDTPLNIYADGFVALLFFSLFALSIALQYCSHTTWVKRLFIWLNAGAYLDEWATRLTLKIWPSLSFLELQHAQWHVKNEAK